MNRTNHQEEIITEELDTGGGCWSLSLEFEDQR